VKPTEISVLAKLKGQLYDKKPGNFVEKRV
jgi:hypothetical protein